MSVLLEFYYKNRLCPRQPKDNLYFVPLPCTNPVSRHWSVPYEWCWIL